MVDVTTNVILGGFGYISDLMFGRQVEEMGWTTSICQECPELLGVDTGSVVALSRHFIERIGFAHHELHVFNSSLVLCLLSNKATCSHERRGDRHGRYSFDES